METTTLQEVEPEAHKALAGEAMTSPRVVLNVPRSIWWEAALFLFSFGLYASFWLVLRVRELKKITGEAYRPWLWFFVPIVGIAQIFAMPNFFAVIDKLEAENGLPSWGVWNIVWTAMLFAITLYFHLLSLFEFSYLLFLLVFLVSVIMWCVLHLRFARLKRSLANVDLQPRKSSDRWKACLALVLCAPFSSLFIYSIVTTVLQGSLREFEQGETYVVEEHGVGLTFLQAGWSQVGIGTYSDGSGLSEMQGPLIGSYFIVFKHGVDDTFDGVAYWRLKQMQKNIQKEKCTHERKFIDDSTDVVVFFYCEGRLYGEPALESSTLIKTKQGMYELHGSLTTATLSYSAHRDAYLSMARGFMAQ